jgi:hypothetical protein
MLRFEHRSNKSLPGIVSDSTGSRGWKVLADAKKLVLKGWLAYWYERCDLLTRARGANVHEHKADTSNVTVQSKERGKVLEKMDRN